MRRRDDGLEMDLPSTKLKLYRNIRRANTAGPEAPPRALTRPQVLSKLKLPLAINVRALCGANLVTSFRSKREQLASSQDLRLKSKARFWP